MSPDVTDVLAAVSWHDMDFNPRLVLAAVTCPVLTIYGETDEWMPIEESEAAWLDAKDHGAITDLTLVRIEGADHLPTTYGRPDADDISPLYSERMIHWLASSHRRGVRRRHRGRAHRRLPGAAAALVLTNQ